MNENDEKEYDSVLDKAKQKVYYIMIGCVSFIALVILPFIGGAEGDLVFPQSKAEWVIWAFNRVVVSIINVMLFYCFMQQGKLNVKDSKEYKEAINILSKYKNEAVQEPKSPKEWQSYEYRHKGVSILLGTLTSSFALTQMVINFDVKAMISYFSVIFMGIIFGVLQMKKAEEYWTEEFLNFAKKIEKSKKSDQVIKDLKLYIAEIAKSILEEEENV